ncbi:MAG: GNAT family N-acetyltransferase [Haloarculaceae archaeon]
MIRTAGPSDLPRLRAIQTAALDEPWPDLLEAGVGGPPLVLVLETDGRPAGYALVVRDPPVAYLAEFAIAPDAQGEGRGSRLIEALFERLARDGIDRLRLTARADDDRVRSFYAEHGFAVIERLPDHYEDGDGVLLARDL